MAAPPLTHHDILSLVQPFARAGRHVDLAASDRTARRIAFKTIVHDSAPPLNAVVHEDLVLESLGTGTFALTRTLSLDRAPKATLQAMGEDPCELLARLEAVPLHRHFSLAPGRAVARSYALRLEAGTVTPVLTQGTVEAGGLTLTMAVSSVPGLAAELSIKPISGVTFDLPQDLLAVQGWDWARLIGERDGWHSRMRLRGRAARRTRTAEAALEQVAAHLALSLSEAPARFHERHLVARYGVVLRRSIPMLTPLVLLVMVLGMPKVVVGGSALWHLLFHIPTLFIVLSFRLQELPQFEIPPWPRRSTAERWWRPQGGQGTGAALAPPPVDSAAGLHG